jgi:hypothetical protein
MPVLAVAAAGALATAAASAGTVAALGGVAAATAFTVAGVAVTVGTVASVVGAVVGALVAYAGSALLASSAKKPSTQQAAADARATIRSSVEPRRIVYGRARVSGPIVYAASEGYQRENLHLVIPLAGHTSEGWGAIFLNDQIITPADVTPGGNEVVSGPFAGKVFIFFYDGTQTEASGFLSQVSPDGWGASDKLLGVTYLHIMLRYDPDVFRNGVPNVSVELIGKNDIYDPRYGTRSHRENWSLVILDYLRAPFGLACEDDEIDFDSFMTAANISDEQVAVNDAGTVTQARYTLNGTFQLDRTPLEVVEEMVAAGGGALVYVQGKYRLYAGAYVAPEVTITASDLAGPLELVTTPPRRERFNAIRGSYIAPFRSWQAAEFPMVVDQAGVAEDGEQIVRDLDLVWIKDVMHAQRIATQMLKRHRDSMTVRVPLRYASFALTVWDTVAFTLPDFGWTAKPFRVIAWSFDPGTGIINVTLQEEQPQAYAFTPAEAQALPAFPSTTLVSPFSLPAPAGLAVAEELYATRDGAGVRNKAVLSWSPVPNPFVTQYEIQSRPNAAESIWRSAVSVPGDTLTAEVLDLAAGSTEFRVRARTSVGTGAWAEATKQIGELAAVLPADIADFNIQISGGMAWARWTRHPDLDVRAGGRIEFRHHPETGGVWANATTIGESVPGDANFTALPLRTGRYFAKAVDAGGRYSVNAASFYLVGDGQLAYTNLITRTFDPTFPGTGTNTAVVSSTLRLASLGDVDSVASFDAIADLDSLGGIAPSGEMVFTGGAGNLNFGAVQNVRVTPTLRATVVNTLDQWDSRGRKMDTWASVDGIVGGEADAWVEFRTSLNGLGTDWTPWARLDGAEVRTWVVQTRVQLRSYDPAFNIHIDQLRISADQVV